MRRTWVAVAAALWLGGIAGYWLATSREEAEPEEAGAAAAHGSPAAGAPQVHLDAEARKLAGLAVAPLAEVEVPREQRAFGRVLDPTPLAALVYDRDAARAQRRAADREYRRVERLHAGQQNASDRELEAAALAQRQGRVAYENAQAKLLAALGPELAERADLAALVASLTAGRAALVRVDLAPGAPAAQGDARLVALDDPTPRQAAFLGEAPQTDPLLQGRGLLYVWKDEPAPPGTSLVAWLAEPGAPEKGLEVPRKALVRHGGGSFVYVQRSEGVFERVAVELRRPTAAGWLVAGALRPGDDVVIAGGAMLLSTEVLPQLEED